MHGAPRRTEPSEGKVSPSEVFFEIYFLILEYFDPINMFFDNKNKQFSG